MCELFKEGLKIQLQN